MLSPKTQICILDLPGTLFFSYLFVVSNFPESKILFVTKEDSNLNYGTINDQYDFIFVPISMIHILFNESFDFVINTQSLGEMSDRAVNRYMQFIQNDIHAKYFYSVNRYGRVRHTARHPDPGAIGGEDVCKASIKLDPYWKTHLWDLHGKNSFSAIDGVTPPSLEILMEHIPRTYLSDDYRFFISNSLLQEAMLLGVQDEYWQYLMWESIRLYPNVNNLNSYLEFLAKQQYNDFRYYKELYEKLSSK